MRLVSLNRAAAAAGLTPGQMLAGAKALVPDLATRDADPAGEAADLLALARWMMRWTPFAAPARGLTDTHALFLDITGCEHLFGGEEAMLADMLGRLRRLGLRARAAAAATPGAAFALARFAGPARAGLSAPADPAAARALLDPLPVEGLRLDPAVAAGLRALGLKTIGALGHQAPAALARRFGPGLVRALDLAAGRRTEAIDPVAEIAPRRVRLRLLEPLMTQPGLEIAGGRAIGELCAQLDRHGEGARGLVVAFYRVDGRVFELTAGAGLPHRDPAVWTRLLRERLGVADERLDLGFGVDLVEAFAPQVERLAPVAVDLDPVAAAALHSADALHRLADRLSARLGAARVTRLEAIETWAPERATARVPAIPAAPADRAAATPFPAALAARRPALLMGRPEPVEAVAEVPDGPPRLFRWRAGAFRVARAEGPERIACGVGRARDYYRVETDEGRRFWLYRQGLPGQDETPRWYVHGSAA